MKERDFFLHDGKMGAAITLRITPRAARNEVSEILEDGTIKIGLVTGQQNENINQLLVAYLSEVLGVKPNQLEVIGGLEGNDKLVSIIDLDKDTVHDRIIKHVK
jgi:uncharacterized protein YggU (UPF0235/DUF167 family)